MAFAYSNPFAPAPTGPAARAFSTSSGYKSQRYQVLFSGLPQDVGEHEVRDILVSNPLSIPPESIKMTRYYTDDRRFTGTVLIEVGNEVDAERIRRQFSGETIDGTYHLAVQHVLHPTQAYPTPNAPSAASTAPAASQSRQPQASQSRNPAVPARTAPIQPKASSSKAVKPNDPAPGLTLLNRINKNGKPVAGKQSEQAALLARQKANMSKPGNQLLGRMAKPHTTSSAAKGKAGKAAAPQKVARAKQNANKSAMDIDPPLAKAAGGAANGKAPAAPAAAKAKPKTQEQLDEEMKAWERQRRFAAAQ